VTPPVPERISPSGLAFAVGAYLLWGFLPLLFVVLDPAGAVEIVSWRIVQALAFCLLLVTITRRWRPFLALLRDRRAVGMLALAAAFVLVNWSVFIYATISGHVVEAALGYFTNPIVTVLLGVIVLRERLRPLQWVAIGISAVAVLVLAIGYGAFPWIALALAFSFGLYGLVKKQVGPRADAVGGLALETGILAPAAIVALGILAATGQLTIATAGPEHAFLMSLLGIATSIPLILFAAAARRIPLVYLGLVQYLAPIIQLIIGVVILQEPMPLERWIGFGIVWVALAVLTADMLRLGSRQRSMPLPESP
jgi:chloramphenicol-sensitive protein RarD